MYKITGVRMELKKKKLKKLSGEGVTASPMQAT
jgi:hypothetical protein